MRVKEFVKKYGDAKTAAAKDALLKSLNIKNYVGVNTKRAYISLIVSKSNAEYDKDGNIIGRKFNSVRQHVLFTVTLVQLYTDLDIDFQRAEDPDNVDEIYDLLTSSGLIDKIVELIGEKEFGECMLFLGMEGNDFAQNVMSLQAYVGERITRATDMINTLLLSVGDDMSKKLEGIDVDKLREALNAS